MPLVDLDDADALVAADRDGVLRSAATAGAQVRAVHSALDEGVLARLSGVRPRSVVLVAGGDRAGRGASLVATVASGALGFPVLTAACTPPWVGPLDVVIVAGDDAGDPALASSIDAAVRRRADTVVVAPDEGPVREVAAGRALVLAPRVPALRRHTTAGHLAAFVAVLATLDPRWRGGTESLRALADALDAEALTDGPAGEVFRNPAKTIVARLHGRRGLVTGGSPLALEIARTASDAFVHAGAVVAAAPLSDVVASARVLRGDTGVADSIFYDPEIDGPPPVDPVRVLAVATASDRDVTRRRVELLGDAHVLTVAGDDADAAVAGADELDEAALLVARFDMAAAYLELIGGR
nr:tobH protein [Rhodococcus sp. HNM0569]